MIKKKILGLLVAGIAFVLFACATSNIVTKEPGEKEHWVGTWASSYYFGNAGDSLDLIKNAGMIAENELPNSTLRQLIRPAIPGESIRLTFSNEFSTIPLSISGVIFAIAKGGKNT